MSSSNIQQLISNKFTSQKLMNILQITIIPLYSSLMFCASEKKCCDMEKFAQFLLVSEGNGSKFMFFGNNNATNYANVTLETEQEEERTCYVADK